MTQKGMVSIIDELFTVPLSELMKEFSLESIYLPAGEGDILVSNAEVNRPGLALTGFFEYFEPSRIQIIGKAEHKYLTCLEPDQRAERVAALFQRQPVCVVITTAQQPCSEMEEQAKIHGVPFLRTSDSTSPFMAALIASLNVRLAQRVTRHGVLVEVYGEGILILGDSGVGKSETAIELVKRGHRLIADDAVEIKKVSAKTLVGTAPELIRHYVELRGIGIVDVRRIFGMGAVKLTEKIDLIVNLEPWVHGKFYDRLGMDTEYTEIMGIQVPSIIIHVKPGRNLAIIIEIAAMNNRQKKMGYNTALEFNKKLMGQMEVDQNR